jgi:hypothetical protein
LLHPEFHILEAPARTMTSDAKKSSLATLSLAAIGIVYGDIAPGSVCSTAEGAAHSGNDAPCIRSARSAAERVQGEPVLARRPLAREELRTWRACHFREVAASMKSFLGH